MIVPLLPKRGNASRQKWTWTVILNALFCVLRTGCQCLGQNGTVFGPRQRFLLVDTLGLLLSFQVVPANTAETAAAMRGLETLGETYAGVSLTWADQGFAGAPFRTWLKDTLGWDLELTSGISKPGKLDFEVAPRRWVADRPGRCRFVQDSGAYHRVVMSSSTGAVRFRALDSSRNRLGLRRHDPFDGSMLGSMTCHTNANSLKMAR